MARNNYQAGIVITGDASGGIRAIQKTGKELNELEQRFQRGASQSKKFGTDVSSVSQQLHDVDESAGAASGGLEVLRTNLGGVAAAMATAFGAGSIIQQAGLIADTDTLAKSIGVATGELQAWDYASQQAGLSTGAIGDILKDVAERIGEFSSEGTGEAAALFENLNLQVEEMRRLSPDQQLLKIAGAISELNRNEQISYLEKMGNDATRLLPLLENNAAGLKALTNEARSLGVAMDQVDIERAVQADRAMSQLSGTVTGLQNQLAADLGPGLATAVGGLTDIIQEAGGAAAVLDTLQSGATLVAGVIAGRYAAAFAASTQTMAANTAATLAQAQADVTATAAARAKTAETLRVAVSEQAAAKRAYENARATTAATGNTTLRTKAITQLAAANQRAIAAEAAHTAAVNANAAAMARGTVAAQGMAVASRALNGALALVGGPLGAAVLAGAAIYTFRAELGLTIPQIDANTTAVNQLTNGLDDMNQAAAQLTLTSLVGQLAEVRAQAEVTAEEFQKVGQIEGDGGGGFLGVDVTAQTNAVRELGETSNATQQEAANLEAAIALVEARIGQLGERNREVTPTVTEIGDASETAAAKTNELTKATAAQADALDDLRNRLIPGRREVVQLADDMRTLTLAIATGTGNVAENIQMIGLLQQQYIEAQNDTDDLAAKTVDAAFTMEGAFDELRLNGLRRLDDGFADLWQGAIDGSLNASEIMKRVISQTLAEMAHMAITRPIMVQIAGSMGMDGGGGAGSTGAGGFDLSPGGIANAWNMVQNGFGGNSIGQGITSVARSGYGALTGNAVSYGGTGWASSATAGNASWLNNPSNVSNISFGLQSIGGSYAGNELGSAAFGKQANSNIGSTVGAIAGSFLPIPGGTFIGSTIGGMLDSLFGSSEKTYDFDFLQGQHSYVFGDNTSAFGDFGLTRLTDYKLGEEQDQLKAMLQSMAEFDNQLAAAAIPERFEAMKASIDGFTHSGPDDLFETRLRQMITGGQVLAADAIASIIDPERLSQAALGALQLEGIGQQLGEQALSDITAEIERFSGDSVVDAITRMTNAAMAADLLASASQGLNLQFDVTAAGAVNAAGSLAEMVGGVQNLTAIQQGYYQAAYSETERLSLSQAELRESLSSVTDQVPTTVGELRALVEAQSLNDAAAGELAVRLMELAPALKQTNDAVRDAIEQQYQESLGRAPDAAGMDYWFNQVASGALTLEAALEWITKAAGDAGEAINSTATDLLSPLVDQLRASVRARTSELAAERDATIAIQRAHEEALQSQLATARTAAQAEQAAQNDRISATRTYIQEQLDAERTVHDQRMDALNEQRDAFNDQLAASRNIYSELASAVDRMTLGTRDEFIAQRSTAQSQLAAMQVGSIDPDELKQVLGVLTQDSQSLFTNELDWARDSVRTANAVAQLRDEAGTQLTLDEQQLDAYNLRIDQADAQHQQTLQTWQSELNAANEQHDLVMESLANQLAQQETAYERQIEQHRTEMDAAREQYDHEVTLINQQLATMERQASIAEGTYSATVSVARAVAELEQALRDINRDNSELAGYADGGIARGPTSGYAVELHGEEAVIPLKGGSVPVRLQVPQFPTPVVPSPARHNDALNKALLDELKALRADSRNTSRALADRISSLETIVKRWDKLGLPTTREPSA